jgi:hypothetical protein
VNTYFRARDMALTVSSLSPQLQVLIDHELKLNTMSQELNVIKQNISGIKKAVSIHSGSETDEWKKRINGVINSFCIEGKNYQELRRYLYNELQERAKCRLEVRLERLRARCRQQGLSETVIKEKNKLDVIAMDPKLKEIFTAIIKEYTLSQGFGDIILEK